MAIDGYGVGGLFLLFRVSNLMCLVGAGGGKWSWKLVCDFGWVVMG